MQVHRQKEAKNILSSFQETSYLVDWDNSIQNEQRPPRSKRISQKYNNFMMKANASKNGSSDQKDVKAEKIRKSKIKIELPKNVKNLKIYEEISMENNFSKLINLPLILNRRFRDKPRSFDLNKYESLELKTECTSINLYDLSLNLSRSIHKKISLNLSGKAKQNPSHIFLKKIHQHQTSKNQDSLVRIRSSIATSKQREPNIRQIIAQPNHNSKILKFNFTKNRTKTQNSLREN